MSRRQLTLAIVTIISLAATACGTATTAPRHDGDSTGLVVTSGSNG
jgi:hypothetical protein